VAQYSGGDVEGWDVQRWRQELQHRHVIVMTFELLFQVMHRFRFDFGIGLALVLVLDCCCCFSFWYWNRVLFFFSATQIRV
jgi:hypothetical protein